ncbi:MAG TPA: transposase [Burkholderiaceae bacterium]|nr:transposase [Burkholderiaceae bacterium]
MLRGEVDIARGTLAQWCIKSGDLLSPLFLVLQQALMKNPFIHGDETPAQVLEEDGRRAQNRSYIWVCRSVIGSERQVA